MNSPHELAENMQSVDASDINSFPVENGVMDLSRCDSSCYIIVQERKHLTTIIGRSRKLSCLDVIDCPNLENIHCEEISSLSVVRCSNLQEVRGDFDVISVKNCPNLTKMNIPRLWWGIFHNCPQDLYLAGFKSLREFYCDNCPGKIHVENCPKLSRLIRNECGHTHITGSIICAKSEIYLNGISEQHSGSMDSVLSIGELQKVEIFHPNKKMFTIEKPFRVMTQESLRDIKPSDLGEVPGANPPEWKTRRSRC